MAKDFAKKFYDSQAWQACRKAYIAKRIGIDGGLCELCKQVPGYIVHHKTGLTPNNITDPDITLNHCNLLYVCHKCHNDEHDICSVKGLAALLDANGRVIPNPIRESRG